MKTINFTTENVSATRAAKSSIAARMKRAIKNSIDKYANDEFFAIDLIKAGRF